MRRFRERSERNYATARRVSSRSRSSVEVQALGAPAPTEEPSLAVPDPRLASLLLDHEFLLVKVLQCIPVDELPECRRVCHSWARASRQLPVKLSDMRLTEITRALETFPNATHLCLKSSNPLESLETCFSNLARFPRLRSLELHYCNATIDLHSCQSCFGFQRGLKSLHLVDRSSSASPELYSAIRILTQLTALHIDKPENPFHSVADPFTELQNLTELTLKASFLWNADGECMFPLLERLTHLEILWEHPSGRHHYGQEALEAAGCYAPNLVSLSFSFPVIPRQADPGDWSKLKQYQKMKALSVTIAERNDNFFDVLQQLSELESLKICGPFNLRSLRVQMAVFGLTGLRSLTLNGSVGSQATGVDPHFLSSLGRLTSLVITGINFRTSLCYLTQLVHLEVTTHQERTDDLPHSVANMPCLETLKLATVNGSGVRSGVFSRLERLKSLRLSVLGDVHSNFVASLSSLVELTHFGYQQYSGSMTTPSYVTSFGLLANLRSLTISAREEWDWWQCFRNGNFPRLRRLEAPFEELSEDGKRELYRRLPSLNRLICHKK